MAERNPLREPAPVRWLLIGATLLLAINGLQWWSRRYAEDRG